MTKEDVAALVRQFAQAWERADIDAIEDAFHEEGVFISPGGRWQGHAAIRAAVQGFFENADQVKVHILRVIVEGDQGAVEWHWSERQRADGGRYAADDALIFELRAGKIIYWREYFDRIQMQTPLEES